MYSKGIIYLQERKTKQDVNGECKYEIIFANTYMIC